MMQIKQERMGPLGTNTYLVWDEVSGEAILIDPAGPADRVRELLSGCPGQVKYILTTHGHADHVAGLKAAKELTGASILTHFQDAGMLQDTNDSISHYVGIAEPLPKPDVLLGGGEELYLGALRFEVLHTPGHTAGGICLFGHGLLFSGDTLFAGSIGRYDLPGGDFNALQASLLRLRELPEDTVVYPGHGPATTIGAEKLHNRFLRP
jgi:glyoxylase-like metal-dependent hydrolase (beta-lactamase superfamily II)